MAVLVTGGAGYIGSHMVWELLDHGEEVVVLDRLTTGFEWAVPEDARLVVGDIADRTLVENLIREHDIEAIIHFAGSVVVSESVADPLSYYENNTAKSRALIECAIRCGVRHFIFSSTAAVYGNPTHYPVREDADLRPGSPYGASKLMTEIMLQDCAAAYDFRFTALRYFNVSGADPNMRTGQSTQGATHLIKVACEVATKKRSHLTIFGTDYDTPDGTCIRDFIHVSDLVNAHFRALCRLRSGGGSLIANCGYGNGYSVLDVVNAVKEVSQCEVELRFGKRRPGDTVAIVADSELCRRELSWEPKYNNLRLILEHALEWEKKLARRNRL